MRPSMGIIWIQGKRYPSGLPAKDQPTGGLLEMRVRAFPIPTIAFPSPMLNVAAPSETVGEGYTSSIKYLTMCTGTTMAGNCISASD